VTDSLSSAIAPPPGVALGPYDWTAPGTLNSSLAFQCYVNDAGGRKIATVYCTASEKGPTAALLAASYQLYTAAKAAMQRGYDAFPELKAAVEAAENAPQVSAQTRAVEQVPA
jgi:hypothetical protein